MTTFKVLYKDKSKHLSEITMDDVLLTNEEVVALLNKAMTFINEVREVSKDMEKLANNNR